MFEKGIHQDMAAEKKKKKKRMATWVYTMFRKWDTERGGDNKVVSTIRDNQDPSNRSNIKGLIFYDQRVDCFRMNIQMAVCGCFLAVRTMKE